MAAAVVPGLPAPPPVPLTQAQMNQMIFHGQLELTLESFGVIEPIPVPNALGIGTKNPNEVYDLFTPERLFDINTHNGTNCAQSMRQFMNALSPFHPGMQNWEVYRSGINHFMQFVDYAMDPEVLACPSVTRDLDLTTTKNSNLHNGIACGLAAVAFNITADTHETRRTILEIKNLDRGQTMQEQMLSLKYQCSYEMMVKPLLKGIMIYMDSNGCVEAGTVMSRNIGRAYESLQYKVKNQGIWSDGRAKREIRGGNIPGQFVRYMKGAHLPYLTWMTAFNPTLKRNPPSNITLRQRALLPGEYARWVQFHGYGNLFAHPGPDYGANNRQQHLPQQF